MASHPPRRLPAPPANQLRLLHLGPCHLQQLRQLWRRLWPQLLGSSRPRWPSELRSLLPPPPTLPLRAAEAVKAVERVAVLVAVMAPTTGAATGAATGAGTAVVVGEERAAARGVARVVEAAVATAVATGAALVVRAVVERDHNLPGLAAAQAAARAAVRAGVTEVERVAERVAGRAVAQVVATATRRGAAREAAQVAGRGQATVGVRGAGKVEVASLVSLEQSTVPASARAARTAAGVSTTTPRERVSAAGAGAEPSRAGPQGRCRTSASRCTRGLPACCPGRGRGRSGRRSPATPRRWRRQPTTCAGSGPCTRSRRYDCS